MDWKNHLKKQKKNLKNIKNQRQNAKFEQSTSDIAILFQHHILPLF